MERDVAVKIVVRGALFGLLGLALVTPVGAAPRPLAAAPSAAGHAPGLAVDYYFGIFNEIRELVDWMEQAKPKPGPPIAKLDYKVGIGKVLTSSSNDFVGAHVRGLIHLEHAGAYAFEVTSNDGVRIELGGEPLFEDPAVHADTTSDPIPLEAPAAGWYWLEILYFEKKNTSTLILKWRPPGAQAFEVVPEAAFMHAKR